MTATLKKSKQKTCPVDSSSMHAISVENDIVDLCTNCHGIWCDDEELRNIIATLDEVMQSNAFAQLPQDAQIIPSVTSRSKNTDRKCPTCKTHLHESTQSYPSGITLDRCPSGHGVWLDLSELEKIEYLSKKCEKAVEKIQSNYLDALLETKPATANITENSTQKRVEEKIPDSIMHIIKKFIR